MNMVIPNEGKVELLFSCLCALDDSLFEDWWIELFVNHVTVADSSILGDFLIASFPGYAAFSQTRAGFNAAESVVDHAITENTLEPSFSCTGGGGQLVYGWIMYGKITNVVYAGQNFDTPHNMNAGAIESLAPFDFRLKTLT